MMYSKLVNFGGSLLNRKVSRYLLTKRMVLSPPGSGAGKGGGGGGSIKSSGGGLGRYGAAQEENYFYNKSKEELSKIKQKLKQLEQTASKQKKEDN